MYLDSLMVASELSKNSPKLSSNFIQSSFLYSFSLSRCLDIVWLNRLGVNTHRSCFLFYFAHNLKLRIAFKPLKTVFMDSQ